MIKCEGPLVSVIVPVYNVELYLEECLNSIIHQTLWDIEIICVNDGSTDASPEILQRYAKEDKRIRIIDQENQGLSGTRNAGVRAATGKYLYFVDSDDALDKEALELCVSDMERRDLEFVCFNAVAFGDDVERAKEAGERNSKYYKKNLDEDRVYAGKELFIELNSAERFTVPVWACMILRSKFIEYNLWFHNGIFYEDEPWMFATLLSLSRCGCMNRIMYYYRLRNGSIVHLTPSFRHAYGFFTAILDEQRFLLDNRNLLQDEQFKQIVAEHFARLQRIAIQKYRSCSEAEKQKHYQLSEEEFIRFQQTVVNPISMMDAIERKMKKQKASVVEKVKTLEKDKVAFEIEKQKLVDKNRSLTMSLSYRLGRAFTFFPRKAKKGMRKIGMLQSAGKKGKQASQDLPNRIVVLPSEVTGNHIIYHYQVSGDWKACFNLENSFEITYPYNMEEIPESIRIIPFLAQVLPVSWVYNAKIEIPVCDAEFYNCLESVKDGYRKMYPQTVFGGEVKTGQIVSNRRTAKNTLVCFSGGIDAHCTTISHLTEKPLLVSLWGADVPAEDEEGWKSVEMLIRSNAAKFGLESITIRTNFRKLLNDKELSEKIKTTGDSWWHGFQHGIGILGHMAPVAWHEGIGTVYIASSFAPEFLHKYTCASDPSIDNYVRFCGAEVVHDGHTLNRQDKIKQIISYSKESNLHFPLHVCWEKRGGDNCCHCEKCWRTMLGLYAEGADPKTYGFPLFEGLDCLSDDLQRDYSRFQHEAEPNYTPIQKRLQERMKREDISSDLVWLAEGDLARIEDGSLRLYEGKLLRPIWLLGTPDHRNMGDQCIAEEEIRFLQTILPDRCVVEINETDLKKKRYSQLEQILPSQTVLLHGGGNLGTLYPNHEDTRRIILEKMRNNRVIIFPQSIWFSEDEEGGKSLIEAKEIYKGDNILICCRDIVSYQFAQENFACKSILVPDIVLWESKQKLMMPKRYGAMVLLRDDKERELRDNDRIAIESYLAKRFHSLENFDTLLKSGKVTRGNRKEKIDELIKRIASMECVITDRLHGMILCAVTGTPCVVFGNGYHKVEAFYEWLKDLKYIRFIHRTDELAGAVEEVCSSTERFYPEKEMREQFGELVRYIHDAETSK